MKKIVAIVLLIVATLMSGMFIWGFIDNQNKESMSEESKGTAQNEQPPQTSSSKDSSNMPQSGKVISATELSKHNKSNDCWVAIRGNVYDVTSYLDEHPGGADLILSYCGRDATAPFNNKGGEGKHSSKAEALLNNYLVGTFN